MKEKIQFKYEAEIQGYIIAMPEIIHMSSIDEWIAGFSLELASFPPEKRVVMLVNTNQHNFESIQCLKTLRMFFYDNPIFLSNGVTVAFVAPEKYVKPHIESEVEAYFDCCEQAFMWLKGLVR